MRLSIWFPITEGSLYTRFVTSRLHCVHNQLIILLIGSFCLIMKHLKCLMDKLYFFLYLADNESVKENSPFDILSLKSRASNVRDQILKEEKGKEVNFILLNLLFPFIYI